MCDVDVGRGMVFGFEERREEMEKQRRKREKRTELMRQRIKKFRGEKVKKKIYIYIYFRTLLQYNSNFRIVL